MKMVSTPMGIKTQKQHNVVMGMLRSLQKITLFNNNTPHDPCEITSFVEFSFGKKNNFWEMQKDPALRKMQREK